VPGILRRLDLEADPPRALSATFCRYVEEDFWHVPSLQRSLQQSVEDKQLAPYRRQLVGGAATGADTDGLVDVVGSRVGVSDGNTVMSSPDGASLGALVCAQTADRRKKRVVTIDSLMVSCWWNDTFVCKTSESVSDRNHCRCQPAGTHVYFNILERNGPL
jgi:hypothetical protein